MAARKDAPVLLGPPRYRVRYRTEPGGRLRSDETLAGRPPTRTTNRVFGDVIVYGRQANGDTHVISAELVEEVVIERCDKYEQWHQIGTWDGTSATPNRGEP